MAISSTMSSVVRALSLPPPLRGSTKVPSADARDMAGPWAAMSRNRWVMTPCGRL